MFCSGKGSFQRAAEIHFDALGSFFGKWICKIYADRRKVFLMTISLLDFKKKLIFSFIVFCGAVFTVFSELNSINSYLSTLSFLLFLVIFYSNLYLNKNDYLSPLTLFSLMYLGYVIGGYYYAYSLDSFGKFVDFTSLNNKEIISLMQYGLIFAIVSYLFFVIGYSILPNRKFFIKKENTKFWNFFGIYYVYLVIPLLFIGIYHWLNVAHQTAGNIFYLFLYFQAFPHMAKEAGISTLPYHFYYAGIFIWLLGLAVNNKKISFLFIFFSVLGMLINLTQGRITLAITFILSQLFFVALLNYKLRSKNIYIFIILMIMAFVAYFLRIISNSLYIGSDLDLRGVDFLRIIVGSGNVADLQQLVIIFSTFDINNSLIGLTYFDWLRNTFGGYFGLSPSSVGLIIKDLYVPETSGAPTPGAIGEAYVNFNIAAPLLFFFVGLIFAYFYNKVLSSGNVFLLLVYSIFLARFVFIYPKVDSTMLSNFFWGAAPMTLLIFTFYLFYKLVKN